MLGRPVLAALTIAAFVAIPVPGASAVPGPNACSTVATSLQPIGPIAIDVGTGVTGGLRHSYTAQDDTWRTALPTPGPAYSVEPHGSWVPPTGANWINSSTTNASHGGSIDVDLPALDALAPGVIDGGAVDDTVAVAGATVGTVGVGTSTTTFRTTFTLPPEVVARHLDIAYAADNGVTFLLNGTPIGGFDPPASASITTQHSAFNQMRPLVYSGPFHDGLNVLDAVVSDHGVATGVIVRGAVRGCAVRGLDPTTCVTVGKDGRPVTYSPAPVDIGTGEDGGTPHTIGAPDPEWRYVTGTGTTDTYSVPDDAWFSSPNANWVNSSPDRRSGYGGIGASATIGEAGPEITIDADPTGVGSTRVYRFTFTLPSDFVYGGLRFQYGGDNDVAFTLNGAPVAAATHAFTAPHQVSLPSAPLVVGTNVLEATVTDHGVITGMFVEGGVFACRNRSVSS